MNTGISQSSVAKRLRSGGMLNDQSVANYYLLLSVPVMKLSDLLFGPRCMMANTLQLNCLL